MLPQLWFGQYVGEVGWPVVYANLILPVTTGEGDHAQHGGGGTRNESSVTTTSSESIVVAARLRPPSDPLRPLSDALRLAIAFAEITPSTAPRSQACAGCASLPAMSQPPPPQAGEDEARGSSPRGMISFVTAGLDPAVHSDRPRIWKFSMAPSRFARSQACAGCAACLRCSAPSPPRAGEGSEGVVAAWIAGSRACQRGPAMTISESHAWVGETGRGTMLVRMTWIGVPPRIAPSLIYRSMD